MELDDRITIATPEGIELELQLAGLGSRFIAGAVDLIIQLTVTLALVLLTGDVFAGGNLNAVALILGAFAIWFLYPIVFEVLNRGRTPGKLFNHLRVVRQSGAPVDLPASALRNLVRILDGPLLSYLPTIVSIVVTARNQRPGDIAAGTLVIREAPRPKVTARAARPAPAPAPPTPAPPSLAPPSLAPPRATAADGVLPAWDVTAITTAELAAVRRFLERRETFDSEAREQLASRLAGGLSTKVAGAPSPIEDKERFLQTIVELKARGR